jgi:hypothetical protein
MSFITQRKMLVDAGFIGFHLGYGKSWTSSYDPVLVYKKKPYIPILEMPASAFYSLDDEQLLKVIKAEVVSVYGFDLSQAKYELEDLMACAAIGRKDANSLTDQVARYKANTAITLSITKARNKVKKLTKRVDSYKNLGSVSQ